MNKLLSSHNYTFSQVMYATRSGRKTILHMTSGEDLETYLPIHRLMEEAPAGTFLSANKGIVLSCLHITSTEGNVYVMEDGMRFTGRARKSAIKYVKSATGSASRYSPNGLWEDYSRYAAFDELPLAFCVIELVFDGRGRGMDFIFRYCNKEMEILEGKSIEEMLNKSFYEVFENGDRKWLVTYADVALNGAKRTIESYSPEIGAHLRIICYQPKPNFCACLLIKTGPSYKPTGHWTQFIGDHLTN
ncbi:MAG: PAS domain-containing protein [Eubacteriales bacterium]|nr:PAS domain-containing protein [Eubacteriales bacterium]